MNEMGCGGVRPDQRIQRCGSDERTGCREYDGQAAHDGRPTNAARGKCSPPRAFFWEWAHSLCLARATHTNPTRKRGAVLAKPNPLRTCSESEPPLRLLLLRVLRIT